VSTTHNKKRRQLPAKICIYISPPKTTASINRRITWFQWIFFYTIESPTCSAGDSGWISSWNVRYVFRRSFS